MSLRDKLHHTPGRKPEATVDPDSSGFARRASNKFRAKYSLALRGESPRTN